MHPSGSEPRKLVGHPAIVIAAERRPACTIVGSKEGGSRWTPAVAALAFNVGRLVAANGFTVITGGLSGVMREAARGALMVPGARTVGLLPGTDAAAANEFIQLVIPTGIGLARNVLTALAGDVMIALPGGHGTLQEMSFAIEYKRPVLSVGSWRLPETTNLEMDARPEHIVAWLETQRRK